MKTTLLLLFISIIGFSQTTLIPLGSSWKYLSQGSAAPTNWNTSSFSDAAWPAGNAQLGFGDGDEVTVTPQVVSGSTVVTTYFRKTISIATPTNCTVNMIIDDGSVVYINGVEVNRFNLPTGTILYSTLTPTFTENAPVTFTVPASVFVTGTNIIAVEVHQNALNSSDVSFDFSLSAVLSGCANHLVNYDYPYYIDTKNPALHSSINYGATDFHLPSRFITSWEWIWNYTSSWDTPIKHGFSQTCSWIDVPNKNIVPTKFRGRQYNNPICFTGGDFFTQNSNSTIYADKVAKYQSVFKTGNPLMWTTVYSGTTIVSSYCPSTPTTSSFPIDSNSLAAYSSSGGIIRKNVALVTVDLEEQMGIDGNWGPTGLDNWLNCLQSNNTSTYPCNPIYTGTTAPWVRADGYMPTPTAYMPASMTASDFKKMYFRHMIKAYDAPIKAYKTLSPNPGLIGNYSANINRADIFTVFPSITWTQLTTDATNIHWMFRDTVNFTTFGNYYTSDLDFISPDDYHVWSGRLGIYAPGNGDWLQESLYTVELTKAWFPSKPVLPYHWLKTDFSMPDGSPDYTSWKDSLVAEAMPIFAIMSGADGFILWDGDQRPNVNQHVTDYYVKGMRRLAHFNSILTPTTVTYYKNYDPIQIKNMNAAAYASPSQIYNFGIARGIVKGDSILIAAMNPSAQFYQVTKIPISFSNASYYFNDTVTVVGHKCFLGAAKMCSYGVTTVINSIFEKTNNALIYPNPSKSTISIKGLEDADNIKSIVIRDILGREMFVTNKINEINIEGLQTGNYFVSIYSNENVLLKTLRFIKE